MSILRPWRVLTWKHWAWATAIPIIFAIMGVLASFQYNWYRAHWRILFGSLWLLFFSYTALVAIAVVESSAPADTDPPAWRYAVALLAATAIYVVAILGAFLDLSPHPPLQVVAGQTLPIESKAERRNGALLGTLMDATYGWITILIYVRLRSSRRAARALANAEVDRSEAQRNLLAAQLVAAHAQVDPAFVLQNLADVERAYETDPAHADILLDEFIEFLRDAIPRLRAEERVEAA